MSDQRFNTGNPIGSDSPLDRSDNTRNLDVRMNSEEPAGTDRLGRPVLNWAGIQRAGAGDTSIAVDAAARAVAAAGQVEQDAERIAQDAAQLAVSDVVNAVDGAVDAVEDYAIRAEAASSSAFVNANVFPDVAAGRAAVATGEQFQVVEGSEVVRYRKDSSSSQTAVSRILSASGTKAGIRGAASVFSPESVAIKDGNRNDFAAGVLSVRLSEKYIDNDIVFSVIAANHSTAQGYAFNLMLFDRTSSRFLTFAPEGLVLGSTRPYIAYAERQSLGVVEYPLWDRDAPGIQVGTIAMDWTSLGASGNLNRREDINPGTGALTAAGYSPVVKKSLWTDPAAAEVDQVSAALPLVPDAPVFLSPVWSKGAIIKLDVWGLPEGEGLYLNTLWNGYYNAGIDRYYSSVGFKSTTGYHIAPSVSPESDPAKYAMWIVPGRIEGVAEYELFVNGDPSDLPVGRVVVDWDKVVGTQGQRYVGTDGLSRVNLPYVTVQNFYQDSGGETPVNPWNGKVLAALGDSITYGFIPRNYPGYPGQLSSYAAVMAGTLGMTFLNYGISGSTLGNLGTGQRSPFTTRYQNMSNDADLIVVMGGTNDFRNGVPLGTMSDRTDLSYYGALHVLCEGLIDKYYQAQGTEIGKQKQIVFMTPIKNANNDGVLAVALESYCEAVKEVCAYYSIPVLDLYNESGITPHILRTVQGTDEGYTGMYNPYITDGTHPTQEGQDKMANIVMGFVKTLR